MTESDSPNSATRPAWPAASVVVVNYNTPHLVPRCLDALLALDYPQVEILVVDNGTLDGEPVRLGDLYPQVRVLIPDMHTNLGFGGGANLGWQTATGDILAVVNPDVQVRPDWLRALAQGLRAHADARAAIVGGKLLYPDGRVQHAGGIFRFPEVSTAHIGRGELDSPSYNHPHEVAYVTGAALAITRAAYTELGGFDARFWPVYFEDLDLCTRAWDAGYSVWYIPLAVATHMESASLTYSSPGYFRYYHMNRLRYVLRHYARPQVLGAFSQAEEARLRGDLDPLDRITSLSLYTNPLALAALTDPSGRLELSGFKPGPATARRDRLAGMVGEVLGGWQVTPQPFRSRVPGLAWLRTRLNNLWTRWYVDPIVAQQVAYNAALARAVRELADQVSGLEAALLVRTALEQATADQQLPPQHPRYHRGPRDSPDMG